MPEDTPLNPANVDIFTQREADEKLNGHIDATSSPSAQPISSPTKSRPQVTNSTSTQNSSPKFSDYLMSISLVGSIVTLISLLIRIPLHAAAKADIYFKGSRFFVPDFISTILAICGSIAGVFFLIMLIIYIIHLSIHTPNSLKEKLPHIISRIILNLFVIMLFIVTLLLQ